MPLNWTTTAATDNQGIKILVYGPAGYGKTVLCGTMPSPAIISVEGGMLSLNPANQKRIFGAARDIPVIEIRSAKDLEEAANFFASSQYAQGLNPCLDSVSEIAEVVLASLKKGVRDPRMAYGEMNEKMTAFIRFFRDLPGRHVLFTAKMDMDKDIDGIVRRCPSMPGKQLTQNLPHFFDEVFAIDIGELPDVAKTKYRYLRTQPNINFTAKDRSGALAEIEEPNLAKIISKIQNTRHVQ